VSIRSRGPVKLGFVCQEGQYRTSEVRIRLWESPVKKTDTADRQNTTGEGLTKKNPGARIQDREDNVFSLCGVRLCNK
jgi:hypothetical protein